MRHRDPEQENVHSLGFPPTDHSDGSGNLRFVNMQECAQKDATISAFKIYFFKTTKFLLTNIC
jgi:hypothetical protein